ncbi:MAG: hypothetical protein PVG14_20710, partial [Anaerolineales bacterium]
YVHSELGAHPIADIPLQPEQVLQYRQVGFTKAAPVVVNLVGCWGRSYEQPIYLLSNLAGKYLICRYYHRRALIETLFSYQKSRAFTSTRAISRIRSGSANCW